MKKINYILFKNIPFLLLVQCIISLSFTVALQKSDNKIYWSKNQLLTWEDFKGKPSKSNPHAAYTDSGIDFGYSYKSSDHNLVIELRTNFIKNKSSVKPDKKSEHLLKHEQDHFDISEIYTSKFRKNIIEEKFNEKNFDKKLQSLSDKYFNELHKYQDLYDEETNHSQNKLKQAEWDVKIAKELKELEKFSESNFTIEIK